LRSCGAVTYFGFVAIGRGWIENDYQPFNRASTQSGAPPLERFLKLWRPMTDTQYPLDWKLFGRTYFGCIGIGCTDQFIVAADIISKGPVSNARKGALFAGF